MTDYASDVKAYTQQIRAQLVNANMPDGAVPNDLEQQKMILMTVDSMDRSEVAHARIKQEDRKIDNQEQTNAVVAAILSSSTLRNNQTLPPPIDVTPAMQPPETLTPLVTVPGELDIGLHDMTYDSIMGETP